MKGTTFLPGVALLLAVQGEAKAQRTWLDQVLAPTSKAQAAFYKEPAGESGTLYVGRIYTLDGKLKAEATYKDAELFLLHGPATFYHPDGRVESSGNYEMGNKTGVWQRNDQWGRALAEKVYDHKPLENIVYTMARTMPEFPGGQTAMVRAVKAKVGRQSSDALASFVVEKDGRVTDVRVSGTDERAAGEIAELITTAQWSAGNNDGLPVRVRMNVPLR